MDIAVELSLYPLEQDLIPRIKAFIDRLNTVQGVRVITNSLSTQVVGPYELVFAALAKEIRTTFEQVDRSVVVMKIIGPLSEPGMIQMMDTLIAALQAMSIAETVAVILGVVYLVLAVRRSRWCWVAGGSALPS